MRLSVRTVCTAEEEQVDACQATEVTNEVEENAEQFTTDDHDEPCIEESNGGSLEPGDATSLRDSLHFTPCTLALCPCPSRNGIRTII